MSKVTTCLVIMMASIMVGCASVTHLNSESSSGCNVQVYTDKESALANGEIVELCVISGTSAWSYGQCQRFTFNDSY